MEDNLDDLRSFICFQVETLSFPFASAELLYVRGALFKQVFMFIPQFFGLSTCRLMFRNGMESFEDSCSGDYTLSKPSLLPDR